VKKSGAEAAGSSGQVPAPPAPAASTPIVPPPAEADDEAAKLPITGDGGDAEDPDREGEDDITTI
jgi:hypothetical protein